MSDQTGIHDYGADIYTEAARNNDTLANLGPPVHGLGSGPAPREPTFIPWDPART